MIIDRQTLERWHCAWSHFTVSSPGILQCEERSQISSKPLMWRALWWPQIIYIHLWRPVLWVYHPRGQDNTFIFQEKQSTKPVKKLPGRDITVPINQPREGPTWIFIVLRTAWSAGDDPDDPTNHLPLGLHARSRPRHSGGYLWLFVCMYVCVCQCVWVCVRVAAPCMRVV